MKKRQRKKNIKKEINEARHSVSKFVELIYNQEYTIDECFWELSDETDLKGEIACSGGACEIV